MTFSQAFLFQLEAISSSTFSYESQNLSKLISTGISNNAGTWKLFQEYKTWGLLHLLVLSGSQFYSFSNAWMALSLFLQRLLFKNPSKYLSFCSLAFVSVFYLHCLNTPAPLLRCALLSLFFAIASPQKIEKIVIICGVFIFHLAIENFSPSNSFFLSWLAFFILQLSSFAAKSPIARAIIVTLFMHLSVSLTTASSLSLKSLLIAAISNTLCLYLFEKLLFPMVGLLSAFCVILCPIWVFCLNPYIFKDFLAPILSILLDIVLLPVLVANGTFRYTF